MFASIARFELRYQLRAPVFFIGFALFFLLTFASVTVDTVQIGAKGNVNINSPVALMQTIAIMNVFALVHCRGFRRQRGVAWTRRPASRHSSARRGSPRPRTLEGASWAPWLWPP